MIDEFNSLRTGFARFSADKAMRYRFARALSPYIRELTFDGERVDWIGAGARVKRCVWVMCNPSTADALQLDPTIKRCVAFATAWGANVLEVVNIFALRSTDPRELYKRAFAFRGDDQIANTEIVRACTDAWLVVAGWGKHGALDRRGEVVRSMLHAGGVTLHHLGLNGDGSPKHPLYLKGGTAPQEWTSP